MLAETPNIGLYLISPSDLTTNAREWALKLNGDSPDSNAAIIDGEIGKLKDNVETRLPKAGITWGQLAGISP